MINYETMSKIFNPLAVLTFITLKPAKDKVDEIFRIREYLDKKGYPYWIVKCESKRGYIHYHGVLEVKKCNRKQITSYINKYMGYCTQKYPIQSLQRVYDYIRDERNKNKDEYYYVDVGKFLEGTSTSPEGGATRKAP